jgi:hypothetical protein
VGVDVDVDVDVDVGVGVGGKVWAHLALTSISSRGDLLAA